MPSPTSPFLRWWPLAVITVAAFWLRTHDLARRPMHADEANQAVKLGELLETGRYAFDPRDHHGPTLYYAAVPVAWLRGQRTLAALTETTVRLVPALFGTAAVVLLALLARRGGRRPCLPFGALPIAAGRDACRHDAPPRTKETPWFAFAAAAFLALSPPAVYYSRYFIQETLLATFTLAAFVCARECWHRRSVGWAVATGACVGLMQATKASAPIFVVAALLAVGPALRAGLGSSATSTPHPRPLRLLAAALLAFLAVVVLFYSSFFTNLTGLRDAVTVYTQTGARVAGGATGHEKPWWYYLQLFGWQRTGGLVWHQLAFSALALVGFALAGRSLLAGDSSKASPASRLLLCAAIYTLVVGAAFSFLAYKTPWHVVHLVPGLALLAAATLAAIARLRTGKLVAAAAALLTAATLFQQAWRSSFLRPHDARNPYAYVHSSPDVLKVRALAEAAVAAAPGRPLRVISEEYWPLPWYLRGVPNVGYWSTPPADCDGALVITSATQADAVRARLRGAYRESILGLRPGVLCIVFTPES